MTKHGSIVRLDAIRAFGFIRSADSASDIFFHLCEYRGTALPRAVLAVVFEEIEVHGKGPQAKAVRTSFSPQGTAHDAPNSDSRHNQRPASIRQSAATTTQLAN